MRTRFRAYIVGHIPTVPTIFTINKFNTAAKELESIRCDFYNPLPALQNDMVSKEQALKQNMQEFLLCNAVYIINERDFQISKLIDVRIALRLNYIIMNQPQFSIAQDKTSEALDE